MSIYTKCLIGRTQVEARIFFTIAFLCCLWDYYWSVRVFDLLVYGMAFSFLLVKSLREKFVFDSGWRLFAFFLLYCLLIFGLVRSQDAMASVGVALGAFFVFPYVLNARVELADVKSTISIILVAHLFFFYVQYLSYYTFGVRYDYHTIFNVASRTYNTGLDFFRASGLFQEPNSYSITIFLLSALYIRFGCPSRIVRFFAPLSMVLSESLWGIGGAVILLLFSTQSKKELMLLVSAFLCLAMFFVLFVAVGFPLLGEVTVNRITNINDDASVMIRFSGFFNPETFFSNMFGDGISTRMFQDYGGANGISFVIYSFGMIGVVVLTVCFSILTRKRKLESLLFVGFASTTYPLWTYAVWWLVLGLLLRDSFVSKLPKNKESFEY